MISPRASSALNNVTRNLFAARQVIQHGSASDDTNDVEVPHETPRDDAFHEAPTPPLPPLPPLEPHVDAFVDALGIGPEPSIQVPNAEKRVTFALEPPIQNAEAPAPTPAPNQEEQGNNEDSPPYPWQDFTRLKVLQLKAQCRKRNLHVSGLKNELIDRLNDYYKYKLWKNP